MGRMSKAEREEQRAAVVFDNELTAAREEAIRREQEAGQAEARAAEARERLQEAQAKADAERDARLCDWATLTLASFNAELAEAQSARQEAQKTLFDRVAAGDFVGCLQDFAVQGEAERRVRAAYQRRDRAHAILHPGAEPLFAPGPHYPLLVDVLRQAGEGYTASLSRRSEDELQAELAAVTAGK